MHHMSIQRSAKVLVRGLVKFVLALAQLAGTNFTTPRTKTLADLCTSDLQDSFERFKRGTYTVKRPTANGDRKPGQKRARQINLYMCIMGVRVRTSVCTFLELMTCHSLNNFYQECRVNNFLPYSAWFDRIWLLLLSLIYTFLGWAVAFFRKQEVLGFLHIHPQAVKACRG